MTDKKTTKTEKQAVKKQPTELKDEQLDEAQGGATAGRFTAARRINTRPRFNPDLVVP